MNLVSKKYFFKFSPASRARDRCCLKFDFEYDLNIREDVSWDMFSHGAIASRDSSPGVAKLLLPLNDVVHVHALFHLSFIQLLNFVLGKRAKELEPLQEKKLPR